MSMIVYPRLFTTRHVEGDQVVVSSGDTSIDVLYRSFINGNVNSKTWPFYRSVLVNALRLFGNFKNWFDDQLSNPNIDGYNREFIKDTLNYIECGSRSMTPATWLDLMSEGGDAHHAHAIPSRLIEQRQLPPTADSFEILQKWVSQPNGMEDLVTSLYLLFGKARSN